MSGHDIRVGVRRELACDPAEAPFEQEVVGVEAGAADQRAADVGEGHQGGGDGREDRFGRRKKKRRKGGMGMGMGGMGMPGMGMGFFFSDPVVANADGNRCAHRRLHAHRLVGLHTHSKTFGGSRPWLHRVGRNRRLLVGLMVNHAMRMARAVHGLCVVSLFRHRQTWPRALGRPNIQRIWLARGLGHIV